MREYDPDTLIVHPGNSTEIAVALAPTDQDHEPRLVTPSDIEIEIRGGDNATRQINNILPPSFPCHRPVVFEVYTSDGNWSSYPPHKHDVHKTDQAGKVVEADLEEVYFYKLDRPEGFALSKSPLSHAVREENRSQIWIQPPDHTM
jgi:5-deoxy-glucuronate isomerase